MLYYLLQYLEEIFQPPGFQVFGFITVRIALAAFTSLLITMFLGKKIIRWLQSKQFQETIREGQDAGAVDHSHKAGTPTMGGIIILISILIPTLLWGKILDMGVILLLVATAWMGAFGFADDYIKVVKRDKRGLAKRTKLVGQISMGLIVGLALYFGTPFDLPSGADIRTMTNIPFFKDQVFDYFPEYLQTATGNSSLGWVIYLPVVIFIMTALSNAVNLTDGLDGLASGVTAFIAAGLVVICYIAGNAIYAPFLGVMYLPGAGEYAIFAASMAAACMGFLWYNGHPAQVFMGDTGSLALGSAVGTLALLVKVELLLPLLCGVFFMETLSVILQTSYFKYSRRRFGEGRRIFKMSPLHHHYEVLGVDESKIVIRFWIVTAIMVIVTLLSFRIR